MVSGAPLRGDGMRAIVTPQKAPRANISNMSTSRRRLTCKLTICVVCTHTTDSVHELGGCDAPARAFV
jgi:hypothetical protein